MLAIEDHCLPFTIRCIENDISVALAYWLPPLPMPMTPVSFFPHSLHDI